MNYKEYEYGPRLFQVGKLYRRRDTSNTFCIITDINVFEDITTASYNVSFTRLNDGKDLTLSFSSFSKNWIEAMNYEFETYSSNSASNTN